MVDDLNKNLYLTNSLKSQEVRLFIHGRFQSAAVVLSLTYPS